MAMGTPAINPANTLGERELIALMAMLMSLQAFGIDAMLPALGIMADDFGLCWPECDTRGDCAR